MHGAVAHGAPRRCAGVDGRAGVRIGRCAGPCPGPSRNRRPCRGRSALANGGAGRCEIEHRTAIAAETARRLCCDAGIVPVVDGPNGEPLSVGRRTRSIPARPYAEHWQAATAGCRFPGCPATQRLHGHHVRHWADGGETSLDNLVLLCPTHHRLVHEGGFDVQRLDNGAFPVHQPLWSGHPSPAAAGDLLTRHHRRPERIPRASPSTARPPPRTGTASASTTTMRLMVAMASWGFGGHSAGGGAGGGGLESVVGDAGQQYLLRLVFDDQHVDRRRIDLDLVEMKRRES